METLRERPDWQKDLSAVVQERLSPPALREKLRGYHAGDIAAVLSEADRSDALRVFRSLDNEQRSDVLSYMPDTAQWLDELTARKQAELLSMMEEDDAADILIGWSRGRRDLILSLMDDEKRKSLAMLISFSEDEFGSEMSTNFVAVKEKLTVGEARRSLVRQAADNDNISTVYVVDDDMRFYGAVDLKDLFLTKDTVSVKDIALVSYPYVYAEDIVEDRIGQLADYAEDSIPVLSEDEKLLGVITAADMAELLGNEMSEDYAKLGGLSGEEDLKEPVLLSVKKRFPWLVILLGLGLIVSSVVGLFEGIIAELTIIMAFQSLILDMAGNVGTQSLAVTIRVLMDEKLERHDRLKLIGKEVRTGLVNGLILGSLSFLFIGLYIWLFRKYPAGTAFVMSLSIGLSLMTAMTVSAFAGTVIPMLFRKFHMDPAVASGPFITTLNDLIAVVTYYGLSWLFLIEIMHVV